MLKLNCSVENQSLCGLCFRTPALLNVVASGGLISLGVSIAAMIGTGMIARSIPYEEGFGKKQLAWMAHCAGLSTNSILICFVVNNRPNLLVQIIICLI